MKAFVTYAELRRFGSEADAPRLIKEASAKEGKTVFLSHSSADDEMLPGTISILENHSGRVYVDRKDPVLKQMEMFGIAERLRQAVRTCKKFVLLVTPKSKGSAWIPWELGLGDAGAGSDNVTLFPSAESADEQEWSEREYLGLYQRIIWGNFAGESTNQWMVLNHRENSGRRLEEWLRS